MLKAYAVGFYKIALDLQETRLYAELGRKRVVSERDQSKFETFLASLKEECGNLELKHTLNMALGIESKYRSKKDGDIFPYEKYTGSDLANDLDAIDISFSSELHEELIFRIASDKTGYFEKDDLFGTEVSGAFPSAIDGIRDAGTCFAIEQWDASVFHLMKTLERGLRALAAKFSVLFEHSTWHTVSSKSKRESGKWIPVLALTGRRSRNSTLKPRVSLCFSKRRGEITSCTWGTFTMKERLSASLPTFEW